jgi:hypothetical protein
VVEEVEEVEAVEVLAEVLAAEAWAWSSILGVFQ